ncbi:MAG: OsmC family protein [Arenicellales bacterium]
MLTTKLKRVGPMAFSASTGSGHTVVMDASPEVGGENKGPRPMEMLLMGLGGCSCIDVVMILEKARQDVKNCRVEISAERAETEPKVFTDIQVHFIVEGHHLSTKRVEKAIALSAEKYCSASIMLGKTAKITHDFEIIESE